MVLVCVDISGDHMEASHLYDLHGWYYLIGAEGCTGDNHSHISCPYPYE